MRAERIYEVSGAGRWFPGEARVLRRVVEQDMDCELPADLSFPLLGGIAPHAGFAYSGAVAGQTYAALRASAAVAGVPAVVAVLGFSHRPAKPGLALLDAAQIRTPLGMLPVDQSATAHLLQSVQAARLDNATHFGEHSAENQLPFLQCALQDVPVVVGLICGQSPEVFGELAQALTELHAERSVVCIASTDLLHDPSYERVCDSDAQTLRMMEKLDSEGLLKAWSPAHQVCCGIAPVTALLRFMRASGGQQGTILCYQNSGDIDPSSRGHWVVGYGAVVYSRGGEQRR